MNEHTNQNKIKPITLIVTAIALVLIVTALLSAKRHMANAPVAADATQDAPSSVCYYLNNPTANGNDVASLKLTTTDGQNATGQFNVALAQKDASTGMLTGVITVTDSSSAVFDGHYVNSQEGMNTTTEQMIKLDQQQAQIGYGEMVQNAAGGYDYKDKSGVTYSLSIPRVDCAQFDGLVAAPQQ